MQRQAVHPLDLAVVVSHTEKRKLCVSIILKRNNTNTTAQHW